MKKTLLLFFALSATHIMNANERTEEDMQAIAARQLMIGASTRSVNTISLKKLISTESYAVFTPMEGKGFVVVSNDDRFMPVLGYSDNTIDVNNMPDGLNWWMTAINTALQDKKAQGRASTRVSGLKPVDNFVTSQWGQGKPYNALTPIQGGKHAVTGCVATALAQILNYYKYPDISTGTGAYTINGDEATNVTIATTYSWESIQDGYNTNGSFTEEESRPIAELMRDCGYSVHMDYSAGSSGALVSEAALGIARNFKFDEAYIYYAMRDYYSDEEWMALLYGELEAKRPILYGAVDEGTNGGHAFVFSGIDEEGRIYTNWGWDGMADGFFNIADLGPKGVLDRSLNHFNSRQEMLFGITPNSASSNLQPKYSEMVMDYDYEIAPSAATNRLSIRIGTFYNLYYKPFNGLIDLVMRSQNGAEYTFNVLTPENKIVYRYGTQLSSKLINVTSLPAGTYTAYLASKNEKDFFYQPFKCAGNGSICYQVTKSEDGRLTVSESAYSLYSGVPTAISSVKAEIPNVMTTNVFTANGQLVYTAPTHDFNLHQVPVHGLLIIKTGNNVWKVIR